MFKQFLGLFSLLAADHRRQLLRLQGLVVISALFEFISLASIVPFIALIGDQSLVFRVNGLLYVYNALEFTQTSIFVAWVGVGVLGLLSLSMGLSLWTSWRLSLLASRMGAEIADCLFLYYMRQPWLFHSLHPSSALTKQISTESVRVAHGMIAPLILVNARLVLVAVLVTGMIWVNPWVALGGLVVFGLAYAVVYLLVRRRVYQQGERLSAMATIRYRLMQEGFGGIRDVLLSHRQGFFMDQFVATSDTLARAIGVNNALVLVPRFVVEWLAFGVLVAVASIWLVLGAQSLMEALPVLVFFVLVAFRLLPALQQVYANLTVMKGNVAAFEAIEGDLRHARELESSRAAQGRTDKVAPRGLVEGVRFRDVGFCYPNASRPALVKVDVFFGAKQTIGLVGASGSGKSTLGDLLLGLITPSEGVMEVDGHVLSKEALGDWQQRVGFVSQSIFLSGGSVADNVAFGVAPCERDEAAVVRALKQAQLWDWVCGLDDGVNSLVGERGVQLSGGQRQRLGIARALYREARVLVLDEATSALDGVTEREVMQSIGAIRGEALLVLIAHRIKTVKDCDVIFVLDGGRVVAQGSYAQLYAQCDVFRALADHG
ncbi:ABC transporter ATP-binding protein [Thiomicrospira microaerophila]|uniref:ABC transporter ATP-binding protein n=1 Tax=Thiomicrospira microaerophila TaxID=406020 RepID=UPI0005C8F670|nr:ABC transporter ATP-binding protein [Thiomicrospira microaerophila]